MGVHVFPLRVFHEFPMIREVAEKSRLETSSVRVNGTALNNADNQRVNRARSALVLLRGTTAGQRDVLYRAPHCHTVRPHHSGNVQRALHALRLPSLRHSLFVYLFFFLIMHASSYGGKKNEKGERKNNKKRVQRPREPSSWKIALSTSSRKPSGLFETNNRFCQEFTKVRPTTSPGKYLLVHALR